MSASSQLPWLVANGSVIFESVGILSYALSGLIEAARKKLDLVGMVMMAAVTSFGGGTLRDILLDRRPFFWVENLYWIYVILGLCIGALLFMRARHLDFTERAMQWPDAIGLGIFSAGGTQIALQAHMPPIVAVVMGVLTAVFGGVARDVMVVEIPKLFIDHQPYAVLAFTGCWIVVIGDSLQWPDFVSLGLSAVFIIALRISAILFGWRLPVWKV